MDAKLELKCLKRYLKNKGVFTAFRRNANNKKIRNITRNSVYEGLDVASVLSTAIKRNDTPYIHNIISVMFVWDETKEGFDFWEKLNKGYRTFRKEYLKKKL